MRHDVHAAALGAASRVAFSILLAGCAGASTTTEVPVDDTKADEAELRQKKKACHEPDAAPAKPACGEVLASAFPNPNAFGAHVDAGADVKACCVELLQSEKDPGIDRPAYHWPCCGATAWGQEADAGLGCTPWGPPVPPAMRVVPATGVA